MERKWRVRRQNEREHAHARASERVSESERERGMDRARERARESATESARAHERQIYVPHVYAITCKRGGERESAKNGERDCEGKKG